MEGGGGHCVLMKKTMMMGVNNKDSLWTEMWIIIKNIYLLKKKKKS